jgi:phosphopantetheine--protein transferase-like protein
MNISVGNDIVYIPRVKSLISSGSLGKILLPSEIKRSSLDHIAGRIALKEAAIKALGLTVDDWLNIVIVQEANRPSIQLLNEQPDVLSMSCSISHDGDYAFATVIVLYSDS